MQESFGFEENDLSQQIEKLLPDDRFFCYDVKDKREYIQSEFDRLLELSFQAGGKVIDNKTSEGFFQPTQMTA